jgi:hypothetical protein
MQAGPSFIHGRRSTRKVDTPKDDSRRMSFAPNFQVFSGGAAFYLIPQLHELCFAFHRTFRSPALIQIIHGSGTDSAWDIRLTIRHGEHDDHAVEVVGEELPSRERHFRGPAEFEAD